MLEWETTPITTPSSDFHLTINHWMGTFTTDFEVCQCLFDAHVAVWLVQKESSILSDMNVHKRIEVTPPTDIMTELEEFNVGQVLQFQNIRYHGGYYQHMYTRCRPQKGIEQFASLFMEETGLTSTSTSTNATQRDTTSSASSVLRTQQSNSQQTPCKYSL